MLKLDLNKLLAALALAFVLGVASFVWAIDKKNQEQEVKLAEQKIEIRELKEAVREIKTLVEKSTESDNALADAVNDLLREVKKSK